MEYYPKYIPGDGLVGSRYLIVGEAPGEHEYDEGKPFVGESGKILVECLNRHGLSRQDVYLTNLCHYRPYANNFNLVLASKVLEQGLKELYDYIETYKPNVIAALGNFPLKFLTGRNGISKWRGSILPFVLNKDIKVIPTLHPAAIFRDFTKYPIFDNDIKRISEDGTYPDRRLPNRQFIIDPKGLDLEEWTERLCSATYLGTDIETVKNSSKILCVGFAPSPEIAVCINAEREEGRRAIGRILTSKARKIFQFGTFDTIQLIYLNGYEFEDSDAFDLGRPYYWDTLIAQHTLAPELPRSLEYLTSIYTREPYYKTVGRGTIPDDEKGWSEKVEKQSLYEYNCRDCCCTIEVALAQMKEIQDERLNEVFDFGMKTIEVARHISISGMLIDQDRRKMIEDILIDKWNRKQGVLNRLTGVETNVRSTKLKSILYEKLGLPAKYKDKRVTTDEDAIVSLITHCKDKIEAYKTQDKKLEWQIKLAVCQLILEIRGIRVLLSNYIRTIQRNKRPRTGMDGRIRSTYALKTETGRWSSSKFVDGTGFNAQTLPRDPIEYEESYLTNTVQPAILSELDEDEVDDNENEEEAA